jgi:Zn-finger nucleic acid-binding protein
MDVKRQHRTGECVSPALKYRTCCCREFLVAVFVLAVLSSETRGQDARGPHAGCVRSIMEAQTLNCPNCGAAISSDSPQCQYCESKLATVACPSCFAMMFIGTKHCPHCGAAAVQATAAQLTVLKCPRCRVDMSSITLGTTAVRECETCTGLWVEVAAFEEICADREQQSAVLGAAAPAPAHQSPSGDPNKIRYVPCPQCSQLMNRINFARCSGVIVDVCKGHGTWFDRDELSGIVQFIRGGGLEVARQKDKAELEFEKQQFRAEQLAAANRANSLGGYSTDDERVGGLSAASGLLKFLLE